MIDLIVCSPPFMDAMPTGKMSDAMVADLLSKGHGPARGSTHQATYGQTPGQLGGMKEGTYPGATAMPEVEADQWQGLYSEGWQGVIVEEAFAHPAKYARALIRRIYEHLRCAKRIAPGMTVLDPFGGVALGALDAMFHGLNWIGVELEKKFANLGLENICLWNERYKGWPGWGTARLLNGDSRRLVDVVKEANCIVSSPPFMGDDPRAQGTGTRKGGIKPPHDSTGRFHEQTYGTTPGQLGSMKPGDVAAVISSPPYEGTGVALPDGAAKRQMESLSKAVAEGRVNGRESLRVVKKGFNANTTLNSSGGNYGQSPGQLGNTTGETFWEASATIVSQCYQLLKPGGVACWITKRFVRNKKIVDFSQQWASLCESIGFKIIHWHHAMLVVEQGTQHLLFDEPERLVKKKCSFFRRLAEKKGSPSIDWEDVICMEK